MPKFNATPLIIAGLVGAGAVVGWWFVRRNRAQALPPPTLEILAPPAGTSVPSGTRIDFSARAMAGAQDISAQIHWRIIEPAFMAREWGTGATTLVIPDFLITRILTMEAYVSDPAPGASAQRSVTVTVTAGLATAGPRPLRDGRERTVLSVVGSFRRTDTGWRVKGRHVLEEPWTLSRR